MNVLLNEIQYVQGSKRSASSRVFIHSRQHQRELNSPATLFRLSLLKLHRQLAQACQPTHLLLLVSRLLRGWIYLDPRLHQKNFHNPC